MDSISFGESFPHVVLVFPDSSGKVRGHADVEGTIPLACRYVYCRQFTHPVPLWIPAFAGMTKDVPSSARLKSTSVNRLSIPDLPDSCIPGTGPLAPAASVLPGSTGPRT